MIPPVSARCRPRPGWVFRVRVVCQVGGLVGAGRSLLMILNSHPSPGQVLHMWVPSMSPPCPDIRLDAQLSPGLPELSHRLTER